MPLILVGNSMLSFFGS